MLQLQEPTNAQALSRLPFNNKIELLSLLEERERFVSRRRIETFYPASGPFRRQLYTKHMAFFKAGALHRERCVLAANRIGKTEGIGAYETTLHLTGEYPSWWEGRRFHRPISAWASGDTSKTTRDIIQLKLLGPHGQYGTGMIPFDRLQNVTAKPGTSEAAEIIHVEHVSGGISTLALKSYDQGRAAFQGTEKDLIWLDEECSREIYTECLMRTMTTNGMLLLTFTPLLGMTPIVRHFLKQDESISDNSNLG